VSTQKFSNLNQTWYARAKKPDKFYNTSLKYGANLDLQTKKVPFMWTLSDATGTFRQIANADRMDNATNQRWKEFNSYETNDVQRIQKDELTQEHTAKALRLVDSREKNKVYNKEMA
jgi:hypothetical protein